MPEEDGLGITSGAEGVEAEDREEERLLSHGDENGGGRRKRDRLSDLARGEWPPI